MSVAAYILVEATPGQAGKVAKQISQIQGVKGSHAVTGPYDIIVLVEANTVSDIGKFVVTKIQEVAGVAKTLTCLVVDF